MNKQELQQQISDLSEAVEVPTNELYEWLRDDRKKALLWQLGILIQAQAKLIELLESDLKRYEDAQVEKLKADCEGQMVFSDYLDQMFGENVKRY